MTDANQRWSVDEAITWMKELAELNPHWIEEPTSPDDILGHAKIARVLIFEFDLLMAGKRRTISWTFIAILEFDEIF